MSTPPPPFQLLLHCLEHVDQSDWSAYISANACSKEVRQKTLQMAREHLGTDQWLPKEDDGSRLAINSELNGAHASPVAKEGDRYLEHDIELLKLIGRGTSNHIFLARQIKVPSHQFVVKTPICETNPTRQLERTEKEFCIQLAAKHPNVADAFSFGNLTSTRPFLTMEIVDGIKLGQLMLQPSECILPVFETLKTICETVADLHSRGITHGDLNPDNIIITDLDSHCRPKLIDFGKAEQHNLKSEPCGNQQTHRILEKLESKDDDTASDPQNRFEKYRSGDIRAIAYMFYAFLGVNHNEVRIAKTYGEEIVNRFDSLHTQVNWNLDNGPITSVSEIIARCNEISDSLSP